MRKFFASAGVALVATAVLAVSAPAQNQAGDSLVNVQIGDITVLVPVSVAANLCDISVNVLAQQLDDGATCTATAESIATPGNGSGGGGGGNTAGNSLVNVQIGDITAKLPIAIAANVCDVDVNVLATQLDLGSATCTAVADSQG